MVKASLRTSKTALKATIDTTAEVVSTKTEAAPAGAPANTSVDAAKEPSLDAMLEGADKAEQPATNAIAPRKAAGAVSTHVESGYGNTEGLEGDWGKDDLKYPQLKQVQGSGPLSQTYDNGTIILGEDELLPAPSVKEGAKNVLLRFVPVHIQKQFREKLAQAAVDAGEMPRIFDTVAEVEEAGLTTRWVGNTMPDNFAEPSAKCMFIIEEPEGTEHPGFVNRLDGKNYAVAVYYAAGGAFRASAKVIFNAALTSLQVPRLNEKNEPEKNERGVILKRTMLHKNFWTMGFQKVKAGNFMPWRPFVKLQKDETGPELRAFIDTLTGATQREQLAASED